MLTRINESDNVQYVSIKCKCGNKLELEIPFQHGFIDILTYRIGCDRCKSSTKINTKDVIYESEMRWDILLEE